MHDTAEVHSRSVTPALLRVGGVSYLNSKPLLYGLDVDAGVKLHLDVPSRLLADLQSASLDVALLPVIDYQNMGGLTILPVGGIASDGPTLTVRIFSSRPIKQIETLAYDPDSHTSVALARIVLAESFGRHPDLIELTPNTPDHVARLLIGDKVVCQPHVGLDHQLDLGAAWKNLTGLPFVFAIWTVRQAIDLGDLPDRLTKALDNGLSHLPEIVTQHAISRGWPRELAMEYLSVNLQFRIGPAHLRAIEHFFDLACRHGIIPKPPRPLQFYGK
jgi:chorismate dehydratase